MKIVRSILDDGNLAPTAVNYLVNIPDDYLYHEKQNLRHPFSIYHVSLRAVTEAFEEVIQKYNHELELYLEKNDVKFYKSLLHAQRELLYRLKEHIDDCYSIFKTLIDPALVTKRLRFTDKYLIAAKFKELDVFNNSISYYKDDYISPLVNSMKHNHARLRGFYFYGSDEIRLGYYLEEMGKDRAIGPSPLVHKDGNSAFSFSRDIPFNLFALYHISEQLIAAVKSFLKLTYNFDLLPSISAGYDEIRQVVENARAIEQKFFPDELLKPCAVVSVESTSNNSTCTLSYPDNSKEHSFPQELRMTCFIYAEKGETFKLPYTELETFNLGVECSLTHRLITHSTRYLMESKI
jgi:hypothetical protein